MNVFRLLRTLRYLRPVQIWGRLWFEAKRTLFKPLIVAAVQRKEAAFAVREISLTLPRCYPQASVQNLQERTFTFLNVSADYRDGIRWNDTSKSKLWLYNLHYFEYLLHLTHDVNENNFNLARSIIEDWLQNNPIGHGNGWEPYPISLRAVHWIFFYAAYASFFKEDPAFDKTFRTSLYRQIAYLNRFLEFHLLANHLWANLKALLFGGIFFGQRKWLAKGTRLLSREINEQILPDGGHFERSPMYHALILTDLIDLSNLLQNSAQDEKEEPANLRTLKAQIEKRIPPMLYWLQAMTHPDERPALFGDTAFNIVPQRREIEKYARLVLGIASPEGPANGAIVLKDSGYFAMRTNDFYLIVDGGELGVTYQPGHAHCDLLSYELSYKGLRFVVDSGVGEYLPTELRRQARSIYSHNTLVINGLEQAEIWSAFRMGRRVHAEKVECKTDSGFEFQGGYANALNRKLAYRHQRQIKVTGGIEVADRWQAATVKSVENLIHLHPQCEVQLAENAVLLKRNGVMLRIAFDGQNIKAELRDWFYVSEFGRVLPANVLVLMPKVPLSEMSYSIQGL